MRGPSPVASVPEERIVHDDREVDALVLGDLSDFFNPFLRHFAREALRCGGEVRVLPPSGTVVGLYLYHPVEREGSVFTRDRRIAAAFRPSPGEAAVYADFDLAPGAEPFTIFGGPTSEGTPPHRYSHAVRLAAPSDRPAMTQLFREVYGEVDARWIDSAPGSREFALVVSVGPELAGVGWVTLADTAGRLHSLTVHPRYRRTGVGSDLVHARVAWLRENGVPEAISEIDDRNVASRRIAEAGGFVPRGRIFRSPRS